MTVRDSRLAVSLSMLIAGGLAVCFLTSSPRAMDVRPVERDALAASPLPDVGRGSIGTGDPVVRAETPGPRTHEGSRDPAAPSSQEIHDLVLARAIRWSDVDALPEALGHEVRMLTARDRLATLSESASQKGIAPLRQPRRLADALDHVLQP